MFPGKFCTFEPRGPNCKYVVWLISHLKALIVTSVAGLATLTTSAHYAQMYKHADMLNAQSVLLVGIFYIPVWRHLLERSLLLIFGLFQQFVVNSCFHPICRFQSTMPELCFGSISLTDTLFKM